MDKSGHYIYCIIDARQERNFGPIGVGEGGSDVMTISYEDLSMVVSSHPLAGLSVSRENMIAHEKVIEEVMKEFDAVLPVRFGMIATSADEIRNLLDRRCAEFKRLLGNMDHKVELSVRGTWKNMEIIFREIAEENKEIREAKEALQHAGDVNNTRPKVKVGQLVEKALTGKKETEQELIVAGLRKIAVDHKLNKTVGDEMFMNASFLVDKGWEKEFDNAMDDLVEKYERRIKFAYTGPMPVFNFANIVIYPEEWEK
jgi:hypothetical protein